MPPSEIIHDCPADATHPHHTQASHATMPVSPRRLESREEPPYDTKRLGPETGPFRRIHTTPSYQAPQWRSIIRGPDGGVEAPGNGGSALKVPGARARNYPSSSPVALNQQAMPRPEGTP